MKIIPAVDIKQRRCVRLFQGKADRESVFSFSPVAMARAWEAKGAELLHVVDLDGAFSGTPKNARLVIRICESVNIPVQVGGGIRTYEEIEHYVRRGIDSVVLGTMVYENPSFVKRVCSRFPGKIAVGIDAKDGQVAIEGWKKVTSKKATDMAKELEDFGVKAVIYTDIKRDGMLTGPNVKAIRKIVEAVNIPVIASGGISRKEDIKKLYEMKEIGLRGVIIGYALYTGLLDLEELIKNMQQLRRDSANR